MRRLFTTLSIITLSVASYAQTAETEKQDTTILKNIEVVKEYNPVIKEVGKISTMPDLKEIKTERKKLDISVWTTPYSIKPSEIPTLDFATAEQDPKKEAKEHYARVGIGNYKSFLGELYTPIYKNNRNFLDFHILHNSTFGDVKLTPKLYPNLPEEVKSQATFNNTRAKINYVRSIKNKELSSFLKVNYDLLKYYGYDSNLQELADNGIRETDNDSLKQNFFRLGANFRFKSKDFISRWKYDFQTNYLLFKNRDDLSEHTIHTLLMGAYRFDNSSLYLNLDMYNIIMGLPESNDRFNFERGETLNNYTLIKLAPNYYFSGEIGEITVGVKGAFSINQGKRGAVTPDVYGKVRLIKNLLYVYAGVTGDYTVNNYQEITKENPYISSDTRIEDTYTPIDAYLGVTLKIAQRVNMDLHAGYKLIENPYFFINRYDTLTGKVLNTFDVIYDKKAGLLNAGLSLNYNWKERLDLHFEGIYNKWALNELEEAWHKPMWNLNFQSSYIATDFLRFRLGYQLEAKRYATVNTEKIALPNTHDLCFGVDYKLFNWLNFFVNFDNIIGQEYVSWYGYTQHRFNVMGGASVVF